MLKGAYGGIGMNSVTFTVLTAQQQHPAINLAKSCDLKFTFCLLRLQTMEPESLLHVANFSTLFVCMVLKFPQIFLLMRTKSTTGLSLNSLLLELTGYVVYSAGPLWPSM